MKTDYLQGIIINSSPELPLYSKIIKSKKLAGKLEQKRNMIDFFGANKPSYQVVYNVPKKLSARRQKKRDAELAELFNRLRIQG